MITTVDGVEFADAWGDRCDVEIDGLTVPVIVRRALIANKRAVARPQDLVDADLLESAD